MGKVTLRQLIDTLGNKDRTIVQLKEDIAQLKMKYARDGYVDDDLNDLRLQLAQGADDYQYLQNLYEERGEFLTEANARVRILEHQIEELQSQIPEESVDETDHTTTL